LLAAHGERLQSALQRAGLTLAAMKIERAVVDEPSVAAQEGGA
jgi:hypothetical protein